MRKRTRTRTFCVQARYPRVKYSEILIATAHSAVLDCPYFYDLALTYSCKNKNELIKEVSRKFLSGT